jgi:hypothetical protein
VSKELILEPIELLKGLLAGYLHLDLIKAG